MIRIGYKERLASIVWRYAKAAWRRMHRPAWEVNHFCEGESGNGEWCLRSTSGPSICGYCKEPNKTEQARKEGDGG